MIEDAENSALNHLDLPPNCVQCPYNKKHKVPVQDFNEHIWKCRTAFIKFFPHTLVLKRCKYVRIHLLPEQEIPIHEHFCSQQKHQLTAQKRLVAPAIDLKLEEIREAQKILADLDKEGESESSEISEDELEPEDQLETVKRVTMLKLQEILDGKKEPREQNDDDNDD